MKLVNFIFLFFFFFLVFTLSINLVLATSVGIIDMTEGKVVYTSPTFINYSLIPSVNSTINWVTGIGTLNDVNNTHFNNEGGELTIDQSWLSGFGNSLWCALTGCALSGDFEARDGNFTRDLHVTDDFFVYDDSSFYDDVEIFGYFDVYGNPRFYDDVVIKNATRMILEIETTNVSKSAELHLLADGTNDLYIYTYGSAAAGVYYGLPRANTSYVDAQGARLVIGTFDSSPMYLASDRKARFILREDGHLVPDDDEDYDLGNVTNRLRDIYVLGEDEEGGIRFVEDDGTYGNLSMDDDFNLLWNGYPIGNGSFEGNLTLAQKITFAFGEIIDNIVDGWIRITGGLNVTGDLVVGGTIINDAIYCESSELNDQIFTVAGVRYRLNISNIDEGNGITMESGGNNGTNISIDVSGVYHLVAQPQVKAGAGGAGDFHMWLEKFSSGTWVDIPDSNIELKLSSLEEDVIVLATTLKLNQGEKLRLVVSVSDNKILLHAQSPAGEPVIPSIIFTMYRIGS